MLIVAQMLGAFRLYASNRATVNNDGGVNKHAIFRKFCLIFLKILLENIAKFSCRGHQAVLFHVRIIILLLIMKG